MGWTGRLLVLVAAMSGLAAALGINGPGHALVLPTAPTVTVPTLPVPVPVPPPTALPPPPLPLPPPPTVELPPVTDSVPAVTAPVPAPPPTQPVVGAPSVVTTTGSPSTGAGAPAASPSAGVEPRSDPPTWSSGTTEHRPSTGTRRQRVEAKAQRSKNRVVVRLEFTLPEARRVFLIVRGPAPSCRIAGVIPFRGRKGLNAATFAGRVRGRPLEPGVYLVTVSPKRRLVASAPTEYVRVASPQRTVPLADSVRKPRCTAQALAADPNARFLANEPPAALPSSPQARPILPAAPLRPPLNPSSPRIDPDEGDDGAFDPLPGLGDIGAATRDTGGAIATIVVVVVAGLLLLAMLGLVARFMRGTWNP